MRRLPRRRAPRIVELLEPRALMAVFTVNSTSDLLNPPAGTVTLRSAIQAANATPGSDTIDLPLAGTYKITKIDTATDNSAGEFAIADAGDLTIQNTSGGIVTIDGGGLNRVFDLNPADSPTLFTVTLGGLNITDGVASGASPNGGGIDAHGGAGVLLESTSLIGNAAAGSGGGIDMEPGDAGGLSVIGGRIASNRSLVNGGGIADSSKGDALSFGADVADNSAGFSGGGIFLGMGNSEANGITIRDNRAGSGSGGGFENAGNGNAVLSGDIIEENFAAGNGGGVSSIATGGLSLTRCFVLDNTAGLSGGGVNENTGDAQIIDTTITGNDAFQNGGGALVGFIGSIELTDSEVSGNTASVDGGGLYVTGAADLTAVGSTVASNVAFSLGGGIALVGATSGDVKVNNSLVRGNAALSDGGGLYADGGTVEITQSRLTGNAASDGGAGFLEGVETISGSTLDGNRAAVVAGALDLQPTKAGSSLLQDTIAFNASGSHDGALKVAGAAGATVSLLFDTIDGNTATMADAGGVDMTTGALAVEDTIIAENTAVTSPSDFLFAGGTVIDDGGNLLGSVLNTGGKLNKAIVGNPLLGPLLDNGGRSAGAPSDSQVLPTQALLPGSPAIGSASGSGITFSGTTDARGFPLHAAGRSLPSIGAYDPQYASNATPNQVFVENAYEVLVGRPADTAGLANSTSFLNAGGSPTALVQILQTTTEYLNREVTSLYRRYLDRAPSASELPAVAGILKAGVTPDQIAADLIGSGEFSQDYEGSNDLFVEGAFQTALGRVTSTPAELAAWDQLLNQGMSRPSVANLLVATQPYLMGWIRADFEAFLGRDPSPSDMAAFLGSAAMGASRTSLEAIILGSSFALRT